MISFTTVALVNSTKWRRWMGKKQTAWHTCPSTKRVIVMIYYALDNIKLALSQLF